jgi:flagellar biosynthesis/type III secretory pathway protein FliH
MKKDEQYCDDSYWLKQVKIDGSLDDVPTEHRTYEVCLEAVKVWHLALNHVPDQHLTRDLISASLTRAYDNGYEEGESAGYHHGYEQGESFGYEQGYSDGVKHEN